MLLHFSLSSFRVPFHYSFFFYCYYYWILWLRLLAISYVCVIFKILIVLLAKYLMLLTYIPPFLKKYCRHLLGGKVLYTVMNFHFEVSSFEVLSGPRLEVWILFHNWKSLQIYSFDEISAREIEPLNCFLLRFALGFDFQFLISLIIE